MKVYAHYECLDNIEYRWRTLLQFGSSWSVLGSVVMKNPGSAHPINQIKESFCIKELGKFDSLTLDFADLKYISSAGLRAVKNLYIKLRGKGGELVITNPAPFVLQVFEMTGFSEMLNI